jgi:hypothetical protein
VSSAGGRAPALVVDYAGRGAVVWRDGRIRFAGPRCQNRIDLERAVEALFEMEQVDLRSAAEVRDALLTIGGARIRRDVMVEGRGELRG